VQDADLRSLKKQKLSALDLLSLNVDFWPEAVIAKCKE
jgi:hypothetical protein